MANVNAPPGELPELAKGTKGGLRACTYAGPGTAPAGAPERPRACQGSWKINYLAGAANAIGETMTSVSSTENPAIAAAYNFSGIRTLVDVGGGNGSLLATILKANPKLKGVLFDQPSVIERARQDRHVTVNGVAERCTLESGDFFEAVPKGGDAYIMKRTLHDWDDERCAKILANCRAAMSQKGMVLVVDAVIAPGNEPDRGKLLDMQMLVIGGHERTKEDFAAVFKNAGLKLTRVVPTKCPLSIVVGVRA